MGQEEAAEAAVAVVVVSGPAAVPHMVWTRVATGVAGERAPVRVQAQHVDVAAHRMLHSSSRQPSTASARLQARR